MPCRGPHIIWVTARSLFAVLRCATCCQLYLLITVWHVSAYTVVKAMPQSMGNSDFRPTLGPRNPRTDRV